MILCDACGSPKTGVYMGGAFICRDCDLPVREAMDKLRADGKSVNVLHIAKKLFREVNNGGDYLLREIPADLKLMLEHRAVDDNASIRDVILIALHKYLSVKAPK